MQHMLRLIFLFLACSSLQLHVSGQITRYIVRLKHKGGSTFSLSNPSAFLSPRAIDRRNRYGIPLDSLDLPVSSQQLTQISSIPNLTILNSSKWLNAICIQTSDPNAISTLNALSFVRSVDGLAARIQQSVGRQKFETESTNPVESSPLRIQSDHFNYGAGSLNEIRLHQGEFLHNIGLRGQGMQIAMLDGGFFNYTTLKAFDSINANGQVLSTWDFVSRNSSVSEDHPHGMQCLSTIAANIPGQFIGKAPKASFHLFRTEDVASEFPIEEFNWVCGAERADSTGADLISSSVGYYDFDNPTFNYTYAQMDGNTSISAIGADMGAKKGLLIVNSAGNEGGNAWKYIITPADADSVLCVGAVNVSGSVGGFSSYGPSADGQIKPDVASVGVSALIQGTGNTVVTGSGTSFACPNMAGLTACLWQGFPEYNNMRIIQVLRESSNRYINPDDRTGYGIPNLKQAFGKLLTQYATSTASVNNCTATLQWNSKDIAAMRYEIERKSPGETNFSKIADVAAKPGTILTNQSYQFQQTLSNVNAGTIQYRIRQIIDTTSSSFTAIYIDTAILNLASNCFATSINNDPAASLTVLIAPNPSTRSSTYLIMESDQPIGPLRIEILNAEGKQIKLISFNKRSGKETLLLPVAGLSAGQYFIRISDRKKIRKTLYWMHLP